VEIIRGKQRYKCRVCRYFFVVGDERTSEQIAALKALCVLFYSLGKSSFCMLGNIVGRDRSLIYHWIREAGLSTEDSVVGSEIREMEFDEMLHFVGLKKTSFGSSKPLTVAHGELLPRYLATVILQRLDGSIAKSII
jgi:hypothetical protein